MAGQKTLKREDIMAGFRSLARSQGFYGRLVNTLEELSDNEKEAFWADLESRNFTDMVDVVMFIEC